MASKTINTILNLKDNMSRNVVRVSSRVSDMSREAQRASIQVANMANGFKKKVDEMATKAVKLGSALAGVGGALAIKTGLSEAMDLEGYRMQLETATKDTKKAAEIMKYSIDLANKTPFEGGQLVEGASKFEAMGMSAQKWLPLVGDMAAATNKDFNQGVEALIDAQAGELERLKEFGITKNMIAAQANKMYKNQQIINNKGQIVDQAKFNEAMIALMQEKYTGGMEKQATTLKGLWSTVTGVTKNALANMVGMTNDGTVKTGSLLDKLKTKVKQLADKFTEWQQDGTLQALADKFTQVFTIIYNVVSGFVNFVIAHKDLFAFLAVAFTGLAIGIKVAQGLSIAMKGLQIAWAVFNGTLAVTPLGWIVIGITALIAAGYLLWKNWESVKQGMANVWDGIKASFATGVNWCVDKLNWLLEKINKIPGINIPLIPKMGYRTQIDNMKSSLAVQKGIDNKFALGTNYFKGGPAIVGERGPEIVNLNKGSSVTPSDKTKNIVGNKGINVYVTIQGNVIGNNEFINQVGDVITNRIKLRLANM